LRIVCLRTSLRSRTLLEAFVAHHLIHLLGHCLDVEHNQLVQVAVVVFAAHSQRPADAELVLLVELEDINVLVHILRDLPRHREMVKTL